MTTVAGTMNTLLELTEELFRTGSSRDVYYTWLWVRTGTDNPCVNQEFKNAWNNCNVFSWIEYRERFSRLFEERSRGYEVNHAWVARMIDKIIDKVDDVNVKAILYDAIKQINEL